MPIDPFLNEAKWKSAGLSLRTAGDKVKHPKTNVSEALRAYWAVANLGIDRGADKSTRLKAIKTATTKCKNDHKSNKAFLAYVDNVEKGVQREAARLNKEIDGLTLDSILANQAYLAAFLAYCTNTEHNPEPLEFLRDVRANVATATLINTYVRSGSAKEVNVDHDLRQAWIDAPANNNAKNVIVREAAEHIKNNELPRFKAKVKIKL